MSWINSNTTYKQNSKNDLSFYHGFSKTPVEPTSSGTAATTLANASTKGGHTVIGTEVWAEEIPWFGLVASRTAAVERLSGLTKLNDLVKIDGEGGKIYKYIGANDATFTEAQWSSFWEEVTLTNGMTLNNRHDQAVLRYYLNQPMQTLTTTNNASIDSKGYATRLFVNESDHTGQTSGGSVVSQFAAGTDNIKNGIPSVELNPKLYLGTTEKIAGTHYYDYNVSGTILWNANVASSSPKISCFRYIGKTVTDAVGTLNGDDTTDGSVAKIVKDAIDALGDIAVKSDITITDIKVQNGNEQAVSLTPNKDKSVTITIPEVQNATTTNPGIVIISDNNAIETSESASTTTATVGAVAATRSAIENQVSSHTSNNNIHITASERSSWNTAATKAGTAVQTVKRADDSSTLISVNQSGTTVSIGLSNTVATKADITSLEDKITDKITDKTVSINAGTNNITAKLTVNENAADSYTISVDGYTVEEANSLLNDKADKEVLENTNIKVSNLTKNLQDVESNLLKHTSNADEGTLHVTQAEKDIWNAGGNALQEIKEGNHIEVSGNTVGVNTTSLVADTTFTTKVNELIEVETTRATQREDEIENLIKNKVEALPSVYTGNNEFYVNCYGFEYPNHSENIILDKIEVKAAKDENNFNEWFAPNAPDDITFSEISDNVCKIKVVKNYTEEIATSEYNSNKLGDINLLQFKFNKGITLESDCNYRFYFYDKNDALFAAPVIINTVNNGETLLNRNSVANRYLSGPTDESYWGVYGVIKDNYVFNGLGVKLINSVQEHINDESIHFSQKEYIIVDENGNPVEITFSDRITNGTQMFSSWAMDTFIHSLPQLKNGYQMFRNCKNLTTFLGELPLLEDGTQMFFSCKLNALSAITIIDSLKNNLAPAEKSYSIHLGISEETKTDENLLLALEESGNEVNSSYNITNKNGATWTINFIINA